MADDFHVRLGVARARVRLSQKDVADQLGLSTQAISKWEKDGFPQSSQLVKLARILDCSIDWLFCQHELDFKTCPECQSETLAARGP